MKTLIQLTAAIFLVLTLSLKAGEKTDAARLQPSLLSRRMLMLQQETGNAAEKGKKTGWTKYCCLIQKTDQGNTCGCFLGFPSGKNMPKSRKWTQWAVSSLSITYGVFGYFTMLKAGDAKTRYDNATRSDDAKRLGDDLDDLTKKAYNQITMSVFFMVTSAMMTMDLEF